VRRLLLVASLLACAPSQGRDSFVLTVALWGSLGPLNPIKLEGEIVAVANPWVFEKVASIDTAGNLRPVFASSIERAPGSRLRVSLGRESTFSDGTPVTDADVARSLGAYHLRVESPERGVLVVEAAQPGVSAEGLVLQAVIFREMNGRFLGSGPFIVASEGDREVRLVRRAAERGRVNEVRLIAYPTPRDAFQHTLKGDANMIVELEPRMREFFDGVPSLRVLRQPGHSADAVMFNPRLSRAERVALSSALASGQVRELAYESGACAESSEANPEPHPIPEGPALNVISWGPFERLAMSVRRGLAERGGEVVSLPVPEVVKRVQSGQFDLYVARPIMWPPSAMANIWRTGSPDNLPGYSNRAVDAALDSGDWEAARAALRDDPPAAFICTREKIAVVDARIKNPMFGPYDLLETLPQWEVAQ
jgi:hypothetical protein